MINEGCQAPIDVLPDDTNAMHQALHSLMEQPEALDWINQEVDACKNKEPGNYPFSDKPIGHGDR